MKRPALKIRTVGKFGSKGEVKQNAVFGVFVCIDIRFVLSIRISQAHGTPSERLPGYSDSGQVTVLLSLGEGVDILVIPVGTECVTI